MRSIYTFVTYKLNNASLEVLQCPEMNNICSRVFQELALLRGIPGALRVRRVSRHVNMSYPMVDFQLNGSEIKPSFSQ